MPKVSIPIQIVLVVLVAIWVPIGLMILGYL